MIRFDDRFYDWMFKASLLIFQLFKVLGHPTRTLQMNSLMDPVGIGNM